VPENGGFRGTNRPKGGNEIDNRFKAKLTESTEFVITFELVPGVAAHSPKLDAILDFADRAAADQLLDGLTLTDNPGGHPSLGPDVLGKEIAGQGISPIIHLTCRDTNRLGIYSRLQQLNRLDIENVLALTGDYPAQSESGIAKPGFDLDAVSLLCLLKATNSAQQPICMRDACMRAARDTAPNFFAGVAVSCYKATEAEQLVQYYKLQRKIRSGARFVITQLCYDARKFQELILFLEAAKVNVPVLGSVFMLTAASARYMNRGLVPGVWVGDALCETIVEETKRKGKAASVERTAKLLAVLKGLGYRGAHIGGAPIYADVKQVVMRFRQLESRWREFLCEFDYPHPGGFYLYKRDANTGLNTETPAPLAKNSRRSALAMCCYEAFHKTIFDKTTPLFPMFKGIAALCDKSCPGRWLYQLPEDISKRWLFDCRRCGDCALSQMAYLCPESKCPKKLRNGACGGSADGKCEVHSDQACVWISVYERLKAMGREQELTQGCVPPRDWALDQTSSWLNFYQERDHFSKCVCEKATDT